MFRPQNLISQTDTKERSQTESSHDVTDVIISLDLEIDIRSMYYVESVNIDLLWPKWIQRGM